MTFACGIIDILEDSNIKTSTSSRQLLYIGLLYFKIFVLNPIK